MDTAITANVLETHRAYPLESGTHKSGRGALTFSDHINYYATRADRFGIPGLPPAGHELRSGSPPPPPPGRTAKRRAF